MSPEGCFPPAQKGPANLYRHIPWERAGEKGLAVAEDVPRGEGSQEQSQELTQGRASRSGAAGKPELSSSARCLTAVRGGSGKRLL